jgi:hypothetical protein
MASGAIEQRHQQPGPAGDAAPKPDLRLGRLFPGLETRGVN